MLMTFIDVLVSCFFFGGASLMRERSVTRALWIAVGTLNALTAVARMTGYLG